MSQLETRSSALAESDVSAALSAPTTFNFELGDRVKATEELTAKEWAGQFFLAPQDATGVVERIDSDGVMVEWTIVGRRQSKQQGCDMQPDVGKLRKIH